MTDTSQTPSPAPATVPPPAGVRFLDAWRSFRALTRDPEDTTQIGEIFEAFGGQRDERLLQRMLDHAGGETILKRRQALADVLSDRDALAQMPEGSLGRAYLDFMVGEQLSTDSLMALADAEPPAGAGDREALGHAFQARLFAMHDLLHIVTGYGRDLVGEAALLAFTYAQTRTRPIGFIVAVIYGLTWLRLPEFVARRLPIPEPPPGFEDRERIVALRRELRDAYRRGRRAGWLPAADWEALLEWPLAEVRRHFGVAKAEYEPVRSGGAPLMVAA